MASVPLLGASLGGLENSKDIAGSLSKDKRNSLRLGIIGFGNRGEELLRLLHLTNPDLADLNIEIRGICEVFKLRLELGLAATGVHSKGYRNYIDLLDSDDIDAVIIATPDHWHARMAIDAAERGKHIYLEKCMTRSVDEALVLRDAVKRNQVVFQLGHQGRQRDLNLKARELMAKGILGKVTLIETTTNRNDPTEGWKTELSEKASSDSIDWELFQGPAGEKHPFSPERYYGWRNYWAYGTGMSGDLLSEEFDTMNSILDLGIPESAMASGGQYFHFDGREVPDVFHAAYEYPHRALTLLYSGTLASGVPRGSLIMGHDATLELGRILSVWADRKSTKYKSRIEAGIIDPSAPFVNYQKEHVDVDATSSATSKYYADRGLTTTYRGEKQISTTRLHLAEWLSCIRSGGQPSCNIDRGFEESVTAHMATISYQEERKVRWDPDNENII